MSYLFFLTGVGGPVSILCMFVASLTSPRTRRTAHLTLRSADVFAGTLAGTVVLGRATLAVRVAVGSDDVEVTGGQVYGTTANGTVDSRDLTTEETVEMLAVARCLWIRNRVVVAAQRIESLRAKAAELRAEGDDDKAARLEAAL